MARHFFLGVSLVWGVLSGQAQAYTSWLSGSAEDVTTQPQPGLLLAGGGTDNDEAMRWLLQRADGGDVVVLRASGADGYNDYLFAELGIEVNSVETIRFDGAAAASDSSVIARIRGAEALFIAGGDQYRYYSYWQNTEVEDALNYLILEKRITVGGTSAGMAILGQSYYVPEGSGATSQEALGNPFHANVAGVLSGDFLMHPLMGRVITDTHYAERNRQGRHLVFMGRLAALTNDQVYGIACNENVAVALTDDGQARVYGNSGTQDHAYFMRTNCVSVFMPEIMLPNLPMTWNRNMSALKVYKVPGTLSGTHWFDVAAWEAGSGGSWEHWWAINGVWNSGPGTEPDCAPTGVSASPALPQVKISPNPADHSVKLGYGDEEAPQSILLINALGQGVRSWPANSHQLSLEGLPRGTYTLLLNWPQGQSAHRLIKN